MKTPKFISNTPDDMHCVPACVGMVLQYFLPGHIFSMQELEKITGFVGDKGSWEMEELLNYNRLGLDAKVVVNNSYEEFGKRGIEYLAEVVGSETAKWAEQQTGDIELEKARAREVAKRDLHIFKIPTKNDVRQFLSEGWLVMLGVNSRKLNGKPGFFGHRVLAYKANNVGVTLHDPGLPAYAARQVDWKLLEKAWADPNDDAKMLIAVKKTNG